MAHGHKSDQNSNCACWQHIICCQHTRTKGSKVEAKAESILCCSLADDVPETLCSVDLNVPKASKGTHTADTHTHKHIGSSVSCSESGSSKSEESNKTIGQAPEPLQLLDLLTVASYRAD